MKISRRRFVADSSGLLFSFSPFLNALADQNKSAFECRSTLSNDKKVLVLVYLAGGNDWLNTIIPYQSSDYYQSRPTLAIATDQILPINDQLALHPALSGMKTLYDQGKLSLLLNIGHDQLNLSHHKSIEIWQSVHSPQSTTTQTWQGRYAKQMSKHFSEPLLFPGINVEPFFQQCESPALTSHLAEKDQLYFSALSKTNNFVFDLDLHYRLIRESNMNKASVGVRSQSDEPGRGAACAPATANTMVSGGYNPSLSTLYANTGFASALKLIADLIKQKHNATIYNISLGGFDTHANQSIEHSLLLNMLSEAIFSFQRDLEVNGLADQVLTLICSEFGRHLKENDQQGTDHGFINHALLVGNAVKGGIYGNQDSLKYSLDTQNQDKRYSLDFRSLQSTILEHWLDCPSESILGKNFATLGLV